MNSDPPSLKAASAVVGVLSVPSLPDRPDALVVPGSAASSTPAIGFKKTPVKPTVSVRGSVSPRATTVAPAPIAACVVCTTTSRPRAAPRPTSPARPAEPISRSTSPVLPATTATLPLAVTWSFAAMAASVLPMAVSTEIVPAAPTSPPIARPATSE